MLRNAMPEPRKRDVLSVVQERLDALRALSACNRSAWLALASANEVRTLRLRDDDSLECHWRAMPRDVKQACWPAIDDRTKTRIRGVMLG